MKQLRSKYQMPMWYLTSPSHVKFDIEIKIYFSLLYSSKLSKIKNKIGMIIEVGILKMSNSTIYHVCLQNYLTSSNLKSKLEICQRMHNLGTWFSNSFLSHLNTYNLGKWFLFSFTVREMIFIFSFWSVGTLLFIFLFTWNYHMSFISIKWLKR